ncbi:flagellar M-ring protein FliF [candidate division WOR-1 bacterium RIFOXYA12_FULL_43_27]|uniref:Flagellar M-ring protein n=1 Tax=candidate division WOR-1 bacterium RIFOXYC2_FULL_46_14 TaxID=1802587 RepID=A0A1F4U2X5_UNCSA|nr:MAG: flagellar M-ring protein FliF [candidate division WOR-1 bacterium RIFOXYA12_FULL_43_27]OGC19099.1 MAG: flagellar M-ring protein FliF [candidate division WOR-1 bacterium RIFOXYB2_FULL_46_45]OGC30087.1 MAG: flagellar M-ring protein FliF [candidate division WOR-1 bacterium RIFOXYA2_FULL_46_56]OGC39328.1 MAG: flagellar M-ring protein FliF [candidate division WOR-1 bacterium RIFOXYC2_FULL_46_14]
MAEPRAQLISNQRLTIIISVLVLVIFIVLFFSFRSCGPGGEKMTVIYSNLDLSDAAKVIARLKEIKIPYEIRDKGSAVAVPKDQAAIARLGLAEKNLPTGGVVGWEIFNETRMGATDFDRRIQLIRAISGELSRNIVRIEGVVDARVQIVLPETKLFEVAKAPVTASVLLKIDPAHRIKPEQIRGIIHLVASSVENLKPENVTVVDERGNILSVLAAPPVQQTVFTAETIARTVLPPPPLPPATAAAVSVVTKEAPVKTVSAEDQELLKLKAKSEYERQLSSACQRVLNNFFPPNKAVAQVAVEFDGKTKDKNYTRLKIKGESATVSANVSRITILVLVDKKIALTSLARRNIYQTLALAVPYNKQRGDRIAIKLVPFYAVASPVISTEAAATSWPVKPEPKQASWLIYAGGAVLFIFIVLVVVGMGRRKKIDLPEREEEQLLYAPPTAEEATDAVKQIKDMAEREPEKVANLLKQWLMEEG